MAERNKVRFDQHVTESTLGVGDRVLVRNVRLRGKHKLADKWEAIVHVVVSQKTGLPVYTVKPENKDGPTRTLHRDLLLPCGFLSETEPTVVTDKPKRPSTRQHPNIETDERELGNDSGEEDDYPSCSFRGPVLRTSRSIQEYEMVMPQGEQSHLVQIQTNSDNVTLSESAPEELDEAVPENVSIPDKDCFPEMEPPISTKESGKGTFPQNETDKCRGGADLQPDVTETNISVPPNGSHIGSPTDMNGMGNTPVERNSPHQEQKDKTEDGPNKTVIQQPPRRSTRERTQPKALTYPELGNPLVSVVQSLFQSLSSAITESFGEPRFIQLPEPEIV